MEKLVIKNAMIFSYLLTDYHIKEVCQPTIELAYLNSCSLELGT